jgi:hypothetical protein
LSNAAPPRPASGVAPCPPPTDNPAGLWGALWRDEPIGDRPFDVLSSGGCPGGIYLGDGWKIAICCRLAAMQLAEAMERLAADADDVPAGEEDTAGHILDNCFGPAWALRQFALPVESADPLAVDPDADPAHHPWFAALDQLIRPTPTSTGSSCGDSSPAPDHPERHHTPPTAPTRTAAGRVFLARIAGFRPGWASPRSRHSTRIDV